MSNLHPKARDRDIEPERGTLDHLAMQRGDLAPECRNHFGRKKSDAAAFPARISDDSNALLRQTRVSTHKLNDPDFDLGPDLIPISPTSAETLRAIYEPKAKELEAAIANAVRRKVRIEGRQVTKDRQMADFRTTYSLFVNMVRSSFRLAGQTELARRLTLTQRRRRSSSSDTPQQQAPPPDDEPTSSDESTQAPAAQAPAPTVPSPGAPAEVAELPAEIARLVSVVEPDHETVDT